MKSIEYTRLMGSESAEQIALFRWAAYESATIKELALLYHVPNGGHRNAATAKRLKSEGVKAGVPDICLPVARDGYHGLYIELKVDKNKPTMHQTAWIDSLNEQGYLAVVCWGWVHAQQVIMNYLKGER